MKFLGCFKLSLDPGYTNKNDTIRNHLKIIFLYYNDRRGAVVKIAICL